MKSVTLLKNLPGDKSLTHRAFILAALLPGKSTVIRPLISGDTLATINCLKKIGIRITKKKDQYLVVGNPKLFLSTKNISLNCQNSGTTMRHLLALLSHAQGKILLKGDASLNSRPMDRIHQPLTHLGAQWKCRTKNKSLPPIEILKPSIAAHLLSAKQSWQLKVASAQVKSALLFWAMLHHKTLTLTGYWQSRDHTERILRWLGAKLKQKKQLHFVPQKMKKSFRLSIPADPSSSIYYLFLADRLGKQRLILPDHYHNPTRTYSWEILRQAGYDLNFLPKRYSSHPEILGTLIFRLTPNKKSAFHIEAQQVPALIDELPLLMVWALFLKQPSSFAGWEELRHKESNRILEVIKLLDCFKLKKHLTIIKNKIYIEPIKHQLPVASKTYRGKDHRLLMLYHCLQLTSGQKISWKKKELQHIAVSNPYWKQNVTDLLM